MGMGQTAGVNNPKKKRPCLDSRWVWMFWVHSIDPLMVHLGIERSNGTSLPSPFSASHSCAVEPGGDYCQE